jgi:hypothetical protein
MGHMFVAREGSALQFGKTVEVLFECPVFLKTRTKCAMHLAIGRAGFSHYLDGDRRGIVSRFFLRALSTPMTKFHHG